MAKFTLAKTIEARKVNPRTRIPTTDPPVTIPYGAILENLAQDGNVDNFTYLGQPYQGAHELVRAALEKAPAAEAAPSPPAQPAASVATPKAEAAKPLLRWESLASTHWELRRARVPGGWLVVVGAGGITFLPDPEHTWDGGSV